MKTFTLSELCEEIGEVLNDTLAPSYWVKAEVSSLSEKGGHMYLELVESQKTKDNSRLMAKMRATCWAGTKELLMAYFEAETGQRLQTGMAVLVEAEIQWHAVYGLSLSIINIDPRYTIGEVARQRQQTIAALQADGLLDAQQLIPLPTLIRRIAVISSASAAGYEDFKHQLDNSGFAFHTELFPAVMQGTNAASSILAALEEISDAFDCVVIIRGGGATSDLSCFDDYTLCACCAQYELPVLTGIGHTRDVSVLDLVAREALKTPTAVAEWLIHRMEEQMARVADLTVRLHRTAERQILIRQHRVDLLEQRLAACNPERIYRMGYSLLTKNGHVVRSVHDLQPGDTVTSHLANGSIQSIVTA
jgi:exodeoxyribonuclease VII large subunit